MQATRWQPGDLVDWEPGTSTKELLAEAPELPFEPEPYTDHERAADIFRALRLHETSDRFIMTTIPGAPWSKSRPRFARSGHTYTPKDDVDAETRTGAYLRRAVETPFTGNVALGCVFFRPNRQRIDTDNLIKHVCDAANGIVWADDSQCTAVMGMIELDVQNPRTLVVIGEHQSSLLRGTDAIYPCAYCGRDIRMDGQAGKLRKTCSPQCTAAIRGHIVLADHPIPCRQCGEWFVRTTVAQTLCSRQCRADLLRGRNRARARPRSQCTDCGAELAHTRGGRCRDCWRASPKRVIS